REIEEFLFTHPDVQEVQVFGIPDERFGEEVVAWIVQREGGALTEEAVKAYCQNQIAHYKIPKYVRIVPELPMTVTGKPQKFIMRDEMMKMLGREKYSSPDPLRPGEGEGNGSSNREPRLPFRENGPS